MKKFSICLLFLIMTICASGTAFAASKKPIKSVSITASCTITAGEFEMDDEEGYEEGIDVRSSDTGYELESYENANSEDEWNEGKAPEIIVYLTAKEGYYFNITKASQIKLKGCKYKSAARQNSSTTLAVTVTLTDIKRAIGEVEEMTLSEKGVCSWEPLDGAGSYEVRFMRDTVSVGGTQTVTGDFLDCGGLLTKEGSYHFRIRAVHKDDPKVKGAWAESPDIYVSEAQAKAYREAAEAAESAGDWIQDKNGWRFRLPDGTFVANAWRRINKEWYYFFPNSYITRGWSQVDGAWYYFDPATGAMWYNTTTPDGYTLGIDGRCSSK